MSGTTEVGCGPRSQTSRSVSVRVNTRVPLPVHRVGPAGSPGPARPPDPPDVPYWSSRLATVPPMASRPPVPRAEGRRPQTWEHRPGRTSRSMPGSTGRTRTRRRPTRGPRPPRPPRVPKAMSTFEVCRTADPELASYSNTWETRAVYDTSNVSGYAARLPRPTGAARPRDRRARGRWRWSRWRDRAPRGRSGSSRYSTRRVPPTKAMDEPMGPVAQLPVTASGGGVDASRWRRWTGRRRGPILPHRRRARPRPAEPSPVRAHRRPGRTRSPRRRCSTNNRPVAGSMETDRGRPARGTLANSLSGAWGSSRWTSFTRGSSGPQRQRCHHLVLGRHQTRRARPGHRRGPVGPL